MSMRAPSHLGAATDDVGEDVGGGEGVGRVIHQGADFGIGGIVDAQALFEKDGADVIGEGVLDDVRVDGDVMVELDGEVGRGMGGV